MMYLQLRFKIYHNELKQMLSSISQLFIFLSLMLQIALPAALLTALISLSVIESSQTAISSRIPYQLGYFLFLYFIVRVQKKAIFVEVSQLYLASLPITKVQKYCATIMLIGLAGNLPLLIPLSVLIANLNASAFTDHLYFSLFVVAIVLNVWLALRGRHFPWLSLLFYPLFMHFYATQMSDSLSSDVLNGCWLIMFIIDYFLKPAAIMKKHHLPMKYYWQIKWIEIKENPTPLLSRIFICALSIVLVGYTQNELATVASGQLQIIFCYIMSLVIGSFQFDNEKFYLRYRLYLASVLLSSRGRYLFDITPAILIAFMIAITLNKYLNFSLFIILLLPVGTAITLTCVTKYKRNFFIVPSVFFICLLMF